MADKLRRWLGPALLVFLIPLDAGAKRPAEAIPRAFVHETVESIATLVRDEYVDPDVASAVAASLRARLAQGRYDRVRSAPALAEQLTRDLFEATHDKHLAVAVIPDAPPEPQPGIAEDNARALTALRSDFGVQRVEILDGNVGYLNLTSFYRPEEAGRAISSAMGTLSHADALILDLRDNGGGSPDGVALFASYFFAQPGLPLFEIVSRSGQGGGRYATSVVEETAGNAGRPVYVLTAAKTFSAGEGLAFLLQERKRAEVVGEKTAGAANPGRPYPVNYRFNVTIPNGRVHMAISGRNWEGAGVVPDVAVPAGDALRVAHARALRGLISKAPEGEWRELLETKLKALSGSK